MKRLMLAIAVLGLGPAAVAADTLDEVRARGSVACGVHTGLAGFATIDRDGVWVGFDVDYCRAVAAAIFDDPNAVEFVPLTAAERFSALTEGRIDLLSRTTSWTMARDTSLDLDFVVTTYFDGQGFLVPRSLGITSVLGLSGAAICVLSGTSGETNLADYFNAWHMTYRPVVLARLDEAQAAYSAGECIAYTADASTLYAARLGLPSPGDHMVLPEVISKEPLSLVVRRGDEAWGDLVRWVHYALVDAEELGVRFDNADALRSSEDASIRRLLGEEGDFGEAIGLTGDWAYRIIRHIGNYGEIFERNLGGSPLGVARGLNAQWRLGGLLYAPPIRRGPST